MEDKKKVGIRMSSMLTLDKMRDAILTYFSLLLQLDIQITVHTPHRTRATATKRALHDHTDANCTLSGNVSVSRLLR